jgi:hypothetical protein
MIRIDCHVRTDFRGMCFASGELVQCSLDSSNSFGIVICETDCQVLVPLCVCGRLGCIGRLFPISLVKLVIFVFIFVVLKFVLPIRWLMNMLVMLALTDTQPFRLIVTLVC